MIEIKKKINIKYKQICFYLYLRIKMVNKYKLSFTFHNRIPILWLFLYSQ